MNQAAPDQRDTKTRILDAAQILFALNGFESTSLRQITAEAQVNLAAVNYHFQSKESLIHATLFRIIEPVNVARIAMLDRYEAENGGEPPTLDQVIRAFLLPTLQAFNDPERPHLPRLLGRIYAEAEYFAPRYFQALLGQVLHRFADALRRCLPGMPGGDLLWAGQFSVGVMIHVLSHGDLIAEMSKGMVATDDIERLVEQMTVYISAGIRAMDAQQALRPSADHPEAQTRTE